MSGRLHDAIKEANDRAVKKLLEARPVLVDVKPAIEVVPDMSRDLLLHAGPPLEWGHMCGPMKTALIGATLFEGLASTFVEAEQKLVSGQIRVEPCHEHSAVGPMAGVTSASMPVVVVRNKTHGNQAYCGIREENTKALRYGVYSEHVHQKLEWVRDILGPLLGAAVVRSGGIDLTSLMSKGLQMGDECHNRLIATTSIFERTVIPYLLELDAPRETVREVVTFLGEDDDFGISLTMPACKSMVDAANGIENSTLITTMARNGVTFGIRVSGLEGEWFTAPAGSIEGRFFPGYGPSDANPDMGDSCITETAGLGAFALAASPAMTQLVGGTAADALRFTREMFEITLTRNPAFPLPSLDFVGTPTGIDLLRVIETGVVPVIDTGIAHRKPGIGQIGAGIVRAPMDCFEKAFRRLASRLGLQ